MMLRYVLLVCVCALLAFPASAAVIRVGVTGAASGFFLVSSARDLGNVDQGGVPADLPISILDFADLPVAAILAGTASSTGKTFLEMLGSTTGSLLYSPSAQSFSECSGLLTILCHANFSLDRILNPQPVFDTVLNTFSVGIRTLNAELQLVPEGLVYLEDSDGEFVLNGIQYFVNSPLVASTFDTITVTAVPLPTAMPLLLSAFATLAVLWRRRNLQAKKACL